MNSFEKSSVKFSHLVVSDCVTPWTIACQASLSITSSRSLPKLMSIESVMPSNHLIFHHPLLLLPSIFPSIRVFSNESALHIRWPKYWSFLHIPQKSALDILCQVFAIKQWAENLSGHLPSWNLILWGRISLVAHTVKNLPSMKETQVWSLVQEDPPEKEMATHSGILAWEIPWTEEPGRLQSMGSQSWTWLSDFYFLSLSVSFSIHSIYVGPKAIFCRVCDLKVITIWNEGTRFTNT